MELTRRTAEAYAAAYRDEEALSPVEAESVESLPAAFRAGEYGRRDAEWVVRWYFRRYLGAYPDAERRRVESQFEGADFERVREAIATATEASDHRGALAALTTLPGVSVPVGSAFLQFIDPDRYLVVGDRTWRVVSELTDLSGPYPEEPTVEDYGRYLDAARTLADELGLDCWELYTVLWRAWKASFDPD